MARMLLRAAFLLPGLLLAACAGEDADTVVSERVEPAALTLAIQAEGTLKSTRLTPLQVPGQRWTSRKLVWLAEEGMPVEEGEVVARFSDEQSRQDLAEAELDLKRNTIARLGKEAELGQTWGRLDVDIADVDWQLAIANRYANASFEALAKNQVLDAVQDREYLGTRQDVLEWRQDQSQERGSAELALLDARRGTLDLQMQQKRDDLSALELVAPHAGIFMLEADWSGEKPRIGSSLFGGRALGSLPDITSMDIDIAVPQVQAQGIEAGAEVEMHPLGKPDQVAHSRIERVAPAAQTRSRENPVKYVMMKAAVPEAAIREYGWLPDQQFTVRITVFAGEAAISVPNLAIDSAGGESRVFVLERGKPVERTVTLGERGANRTRITAGLEAGDQVLIERPEHAP